MENNVGFKITVEFYCPDMIDEQTLNDMFNSDPLAAYKFISDDFNDSPLNFSQYDKIVKVEVIN
jgi:hypothetical protein